MIRWTIIIILIFISCAGSDNLIEEKIIFRKRAIGFRKSYKIKVPEISNQNYDINYLVGGHGHEFRIVYSDSSILYFNNDQAVASINYDNYESIGFQENPFEEMKKDTVIGGKQKNGLYWKELIFKDDSKLGYTNVPLNNKDLFDKSLKTFKK